MKKAKQAFKVFLMKKLWLLSLVFATSFVFCSDQQKSYSEGYNSSQSVQTDDCVIKDYRPTENRNFFFAYGEFLYWKPTQNASDFVVKGQPSEFLPQQQGVPAFQAFGQYGNIRSANFDWTAGLRVGIGGIFQPRNWELDGIFTYIYPDGSSSETKPTINMLNGTLPFRAGTTSLYKASNSISFSYALANLLLKKRLLFADDMIFRFFMGLTGGWFDENWKVSYFAENNVKNTITSDWDFSGGGIRAGVDGEWYICYGFGIEGMVSSGLLYGYYENRFRFKVTAPDNLPPFYMIKSHFDDHRIVPHFQLALGPKWGMMINNVALQIYAHYELNFLFNLHEVHRSDLFSIQDGKNSRYAYGNLGMQGINIGASIAF
ncbi:Lpg1974 family pore-forming outer membrane protein [Simkania negevensis]|uniref:MOMP-like family protein n=1 Tax=Simkania negevensis (strain ATCC VR-1471 / DSM 27360 / Z) TaxID=331113 RepID=F8L5I3_SIMNZ|nr:Lpg1974 family pore-forming outer membrane protein [Simkania negevensis]CCB89471.1 mOMP-like family protein [Simkania negevensis Z]